METDDTAGSPVDGTNPIDPGAAPPQEKHPSPTPEQLHTGTVADSGSGGVVEGIDVAVNGAMIAPEAAQLAGGAISAVGDLASGAVSAAGELASGAGELLSGGAEAAGSVLEGAGSCLEGCGSCSLVVLLALFVMAGSAMAVFR